MSARYQLHHHPAFSELLSKEDLYVLVERGSLGRGEVCTDTQTGMDHTVGEVVSGMRAPRGLTATARVNRPVYQEIRADFLDEEEGEGDEDAEAGDDEEEGEEGDEEETEEDDAEYTADGEKILHLSHPSWLSYTKALFLAMLLAIAAGLLFLFEGQHFLLALLASTATLTCVAIARFSKDYVVTEQRVELIWGVMGRSSKEVRICDIRSIDVYESGLKGLLGLGTLDFSSSANSGVEVQFKNVRGAHAVKQLVRQLQSRPRSS